MKKTLEFFDDSIQGEGFKPGLDYEYILNVHDEIQLEIFEATTKKQDFFSIKAVESIKSAGKYYDLKTELDVEIKFGINWYETH